MPVNYNPDPSAEEFVSDKDVIGKYAQTEPDRRRALDKCLNGPWRTREIGCLERIENARRWGWAMYPYRPGQTGPPEP
jgi:hypothetical protein